jgi:hypothetical protein
MMRTDPEVAIAWGREEGERCREKSEGKETQEEPANLARVVRALLQDLLYYAVQQMQKTGTPREKML